MNDNSITTRDAAGLPQTGGEGSRVFVNLEGGRGAAEAAPGFGAGGSGSKNGQAVVAIVLLVMSAGVIYGMRKAGTVSGISAQTLAVSYTPSAINPDFEQRFDRTMEDLARSGRPLQVPMQEGFMMPFDVDTRLAVGVVAPLDDGSAAARAAQARLAQQRAEEERRNAADAHRRVDQAVASLRVLGMIGGRVPVATIDGRLVRVGDTVAGGALTVESIDGRSVVVTGGGRRFELRMGQGPVELPAEGSN